MAVRAVVLDAGLHCALRRYEVDSAGKTMQALMMGVGVTKGLYDLDTPLADYGAAAPFVVVRLN
eukprot:SAG31_NODE_370_length_16651_cov_3.511056_16_plen_64_part_00